MFYFQFFIALYSKYNSHSGLCRHCFCMIEAFHGTTSSVRQKYFEMDFITNATYQSNGCCINKERDTAFSLIIKVKEIICQCILLFLVKSDQKRFCTKTFDSFPEINNTCRQKPFLIERRLIV